MEIKNVYLIWHEKDHENSCDFPRVSLEMYALFIWSRNIYKRYISNLYCICRNFTYILESHNCMGMSYRVYHKDPITPFLISYSPWWCQFPISFLILLAEYSHFQMRYHLFKYITQKVFKIVKTKCHWISWIHAEWADCI